MTMRKHIFYITLLTTLLFYGCNRFTTFYRAVLPLAAPALVITGLFSFMSSWSEYLVAAQILQDPEM